MILVVEDEADVREELVEMLQLRGFDVRGAGRGAEAVELVRHAKRPLTLLTDLRLREGSGLDLIRAIKSDSILQSKVVRSVLMTGHIDLTEKVQREIARQDIPLLFKPVDFERLLPLLKQAILT